MHICTKVYGVCVCTYIHMYVYTYVCACMHIRSGYVIAQEIAMLHITIINIKIIFLIL